MQPLSLVVVRPLNEEGLLTLTLPLSVCPGNTVQLFAVNYSDMAILPGLQIPSTWIQSLNPLFILALIPATNKFWEWQAEAEPSSVMKMAMGTGQNPPRGSCGVFHCYSTHFDASFGLLVLPLGGICLPLMFV